MAGSFMEVVAQDGGRFNAYVARPAQGSGPGLVVLQEIFGINDTMKATADRFAEEGYVVLVPDLFWRIKPGIELGYGEADMTQALAYLPQFDTRRRHLRLLLPSRDWPDSIARHIIDHPSPIITNGLMYARDSLHLSMHDTRLRRPSH